jgi:TonB family protein
MTSAALLLVSIRVAAQSPAQSVTRTPAASPCALVSADAVTDPAVAEICAGDDAARTPVAAFDSTARTRAWQTAAEHYRHAATLSSKTTTKGVALNALTSMYDAAHLDDFRQIEATLRELIALKLDDLSPMFRLAAAQEDHGLVDAAEDTLLQARRQKPDAVEPYAALSAFYSRQANTRRKANEPTAQAVPSGKQVYHVGGDIRPPRKLVDVRPQYPPDALAAGTGGVVILEATIDEAGSVTDARVLRSIPALDQAALDAVRQWRFLPTTVNGQTVPVMMTVTVNFTPKQSDTPPPSPSAVR